MPIPHAIVKLTDATPPWLAREFSGLPQDRYIAEGYRRRRLSRFAYDGDAFTRLPHGPYVQDTTRGYSTLLGDVERWFDELTKPCLAEPEFDALLRRFVQIAELPTTRGQINVHLIRNVCTPAQAGHPAPEGVHRDGFDRIGIFVVSRENVIGGETTLHARPDAPAIFRAQLEPGECLVVDDTVLYHHTTSVKPAVGDAGHRDVIIFTIDAKP